MNAGHWWNVTDIWGGRGELEVSAVEANRTEYRLYVYWKEGKLVPVVKHRSMNTVWGRDLFNYLFICLFICGLLTAPPVAQSA